MFGRRIFHPLDVITKSQGARVGIQKIKWSTTNLRQKIFRVENEWARVMCCRFSKGRKICCFISWLLELQESTGPAASGCRRMASWIQRGSLASPAAIAMTSAPQHSHSVLWATSKLQVWSLIEICRQETWCWPAPAWPVLCTTLPGKRSLCSEGALPCSSSVCSSLSLCLFLHRSSAKLAVFDTLFKCKSTTFHLQWES